MKDLPGRNRFKISIVQNVVRVVSNTLNASTEELGENKENIYFRLPPELR